MILILGGTTEGRMAVEVLEDGDYPFFYSTRGKLQEVQLRHGQHVTGGMDISQMTAFCREHEIRLLVDAAHPFAEQLHDTVYQVSQTLQLPVVRVERMMPDYSLYAEYIRWCTDYDDVVKQLCANKRKRVLGLTGVQTIQKLKAYWQNHPDTWFRILDREVSRELVDEVGFPMSHICYYKDSTVASEQAIIDELQPDAIITKESGESGGLDSKLLAAKENQLPIYIVQRPTVPSSFFCVDGPHGLRREIEKHVPEFYKLHTGVTTGTCVTTGAICAMQAILGTETLDNKQKLIDVVLPNKETIHVEARLLSINELEAQAEVIKKSGDDPDATQGIAILTTVRLQEKSDSGCADDEAILIDGGVGVGRVTLSGLDIPIGEAAINAVPKQMIRSNLKRLAVDWERYQVIVEVTIPSGEEVAARTFNPRLGIVGGISIVGTSGIIRPFSSEAYVASIARYVEVGVANEPNHLVLNSGAKSEKKLQALYPHIHPTAFIQYGNYIGETLGFCADHKVATVTLGLMIGKAVKLAEGHLDTHSHKVTKNHAFLQEMAREAACSDDHIAAIGALNMARELWSILDTEEMERYQEVLIQRCHTHCDQLLPQGKIEILIIPPAVVKPSK